MKAGDKARVIAPTIEGTVVERRFNKDDQIEFLLVWSEGGVEQRRWFTEAMLAQVSEKEDGQ